MTGEDEQVFVTGDDEVGARLGGRRDDLIVIGIGFDYGGSDDGATSSTASR